MIIQRSSGFEPSRLAGNSFTTEPSARRTLLADNSTTSVNGDDLHPIFTQNNTVLSVDGLNNHPILAGFNDTLTVSGEGGTLNVTGDNNSIIIKGYRITTYDAGINNSVSAQGVHDPVVQVPAPPRPSPAVPAPNTSLAPAPAPFLAPVPAPHVGRRLLSSNSNWLDQAPRSTATLSESAQVGAALGGFAIFSVIACYAARRFGTHQNRRPL